MRQPNTLIPMALPPHRSGAIIEAVEHRNVDGAQVRAAAACTSQAILAAWSIRPDDQRHLTQAQYAQLVTHCFYPQVLDAAFTLVGVVDVAVRVRQLVTGLDA
ncbi:hypothetical protein [Streptomyces sp. NPDC047009]|uniref:hypothetical protein n=1 Tax=Streptomyces sp. NPDC047009 TaxID=3154496 RepID=UPI00340EAF1B